MTDESPWGEGPILMRQAPDSRPHGGSLLHRIKVALAYPLEDPSLDVAYLRVLLGEIRDRLETTESADPDSLRLLVENLTDGVLYWYNEALRLMEKTK